MKEAIIHVNEGLMGPWGTNLRYRSSLKTVNSSTQTNDNRSANARLQVLLIYPAIFELLPAYRHGIFINPTSHDGIKSRFPPIFLLKSRNHT
jgi:hypothetical protein